VIDDSQYSPCNQSDTRESVQPYAEVVQVCNTNLTGAILCCQKAVRVMQRQPQPTAGGGGGGGGGGKTQMYHVYNFGFSQWWGCTS
jgi:NAD(P)-dependent dehydrogenase (short-subunit alcohol dehydrogenase family)